MPRIFDNIQQQLLEALRATLQVSNRADFCVGYLNLRGWQAIDELIQSWQPEQGQVCRVLVGILPFYAKNGLQPPHTSQEKPLHGNVEAPRIICLGGHRR